MNDGLVDPFKKSLRGENSYHCCTCTQFSLSHPPNFSISSSAIQTRNNYEQQIEIWTREREKHIYVYIWDDKLTYFGSAQSQGGDAVKNMEKSQHKDEYVKLVNPIFRH